MAMEALVEYSYRARLRDVTDMRVTIEHSSDPNFTVDVQIDNTQGLAELRSFDVRRRRMQGGGIRVEIVFFFNVREEIVFLLYFV